MEREYVGVDIAGAENTWSASLKSGDSGLAICLQPSRATLASVVSHCSESQVMAVAIDAQLTGAISEENGYRTSDEMLRQMLPREIITWVASASALSAVPVRGRLLAEALSPVVPTIIETHPRASLLFCLGPEFREPIDQYKLAGGEEHCRRILTAWLKKWEIISSTALPLQHDAIDAVVCATVAYALYEKSETLLKLPHTAPDKIGRGPFFVFKKHPGFAA